MKRKFYGKALIFLNECVKKYPKNAMSYYRRGLCHFELKNFEEYIRNIFLAYANNKFIPRITKEVGQCLTNAFTARSREKI